MKGIRTVWYGTMELYENKKVKFREIQKRKPRFYHHGELNNEGEREEWTTPRKMTRSRKKLQEEYNTRNKNRYRKNTTYFII